MGQFSQRIGLVHKLGQLAGAEELLDRRDDRTDIYKRLGCGCVDVLDGHPFANHPFHTGETDTELVLEEFSNRAEPPVPQVVDIVNISHPMVQVEKIADRGDDVFLGNMPGHKGVPVLLQHSYEIFLISLLMFFQNGHEDIIPYLFPDSCPGRIETDVPGNINSEVAHNLYRLAFNIQVDHIGS